MRFFWLRFLGVLSVLLVWSLAGAAIASPPAGVPQQPYVWRSVKVGAGGFVPGIVFSRVEKGLAYLRSDMGGCYRWDNRQKTWIPLQDAMPESSYFGGESIAPDPVDPNVVFIAAGMYRTDSAAMLRSRDRGNTWDVFPVAFHMGGNDDGRGVGERLAIDPNDTSILFFGSRHDGLQRSGDAAESWQKVDGFPIKGRGAPGNDQPTNTGLSFVVFDPKSGTRGAATPTIFVGNADPGDHHLFRSDDAGKTWSPVGGEPDSKMLPLQAQIDDSGILYITYGDGTGPNGVTDGLVMKLDTKAGSWTDITPDKRPDRPKGGYCGLALDRLHLATLAVATMNRWQPVDTVWRSTDGGATWKDIAEKSVRDVDASPFLIWGNDKGHAKLGWWMAALAIDPFDSDHAAYATGATIYATDDFSQVSRGKTTHWKPWVKGIEQTAVITLISPTNGPHLLSGFGDIGGFVHENLEQSPPNGMFLNPLFTTTTSLDYAGMAPDVVVRSGSPADGEAFLGYSTDSGRHWRPMSIPAAATQRGSGEAGRAAVDPHPAIAVSADGKTFMVMTPTPIFTRDQGQHWNAVAGLPRGVRPVADRVDPNVFYAIDFDHRRMYASGDGGENFQPLDMSGLPNDIKADQPAWREAIWPLQATLGIARDLWFIDTGALYHSSDGGRSFVRSAGSVHVEMLSFGKAAKGKNYPSLLAIGTLGGLRAIWRSDDGGSSWLRINDDSHQYGTRFRCIAGDPRIFGRVYVGTDGRGILYGEPTRQ